MAGTPLPVIVNRSGGTAASLGATLGDVLHAAFAEAGLEIDLHLVEGDQMSECLDRHSSAPVIAVGGGDGTLGQSAGVLAGTGTALAILPLGTRNHLARQLGIPLDLIDAAKAIAGGRRSPMDLAKAGERVFINNASAGLYTRLVRAREAARGPKWLATIPAALHVLRHLRDRRVTLTIDGQRRVIKTPLLFIGNNRYSLEPGSVGERDSLTDGVLSLYALAPKSAGQLVAFALRAMFGHADLHNDFAALAEAKTVIIEGHGMVRIAFDGEVEHAQLPLRLEIIPAALEVIVPQARPPR
ncbi:MAG TPA: diacylglycerol kinase family protein [Novosphingobium sp.]|nr:diacylglycerol kinase family protein [Novosphingobium sp.]